ncbi:unnamed protein product [Calypogeia fissa]
MEGEQERLREDLEMTLPEDLVERIISMMPFPSIFEARRLSKSWNARFKPLSSLHDEKEKRMARSFQKQVTERSHTWDSFSPIYTGGTDLVACNQATQELRMVPSVSWISDKEEEIGTLYTQPWASGQSGLLRETGLIDVDIEGTFLYGIRYFDDEVPEVHVANMLTREWKRLTDRPNDDRFITCMKLVVDPSSQSYKVILISDKEMLRFSGQIYDSKSETWSRPQFIHEDDLLDPLTLGSAYLNGVFYWAAKNQTHCLLAFNPETRTSEKQIGIH